MDIDRLKQTILANCDITDAKYSGLYSVCGLVMRLRDLYKWEHRLAPWQDDDASQVLDWIGRKETAWEQLMEAPFTTIELDGHIYDAFDTAAINAVLAPHHLFYGAGYAHSLKPTFFLARIDQTETIDGVAVVCTGREYARDLLTLPAFTQNDTVVLRTEAARMFLWDQILYLSPSGRPAMDFAAQSCGLPDSHNETLRAAFDQIWEIQKTVYVHHEIGELEETVFNRTLWQQMVADYPHSAVELLVRTLKDILADTGPKGALTRLIDGRHAAGLGLYIAFSNGITRLLTQPMRDQFQVFMTDGRWQPVQQAVERVRRDLSDYARHVMSLYSRAKTNGGLADGRREIEETMVARGLMSGT